MPENTIETNQPALKICKGHWTDKHFPGEAVPTERWGYSKDYCQDCVNGMKRISYQRKKLKKEQNQQVTVEDAKKMIHQLSNGEMVIDPKFILTNSVELFLQTPKIEQKIKLLELMAKYSPNMKDVKPQDKKALMASLVESLKKEKIADGLSQGSVPGMDGQ